jgi:hypothetical protein
MNEQKSIIPNYSTNIFYDKKKTKPIDLNEYEIDYFYYVQLKNKSYYVFDGSTVNATEGSKVYANDGSLVYANDGSLVYANDGSIVHARKGSIVSANDGSIVHAYNGSLVHANDGSIVRPMNDDGLIIPEPKPNQQNSHNKEEEILIKQIRYKGRIYQLLENEND